MKLFECQICGQALYFENTTCERCHHRLGYVVEDQSLEAFDPGFAHPTDVWCIAGRNERRYRFCANSFYDACNWVVPAEQPERYCVACRHNHVIPDLSNPVNIQRWRMMEVAKHRLFYTLMELGLPLTTRRQDPAEGLAFDFMEDGAAEPKVLTGHNEGMITINIAEADDAERERRRASMQEPYRTLLGHFRHEIGHWYWDRLVRDTPAIEAYRALFGDERDDYQAALQRHYENGVPEHWRDHFVSAYATSHPWEDFAETFAHYLHIVDTLETASEFGVRVHPRHIRDASSLSATIDFDPRAADNFDAMMQAWLPLIFAVNSLNRSMGQTDLYPFVLSQSVVAKLGFVHDLVHGQVGRAPGQQAALQDGANLPVDNAAVSEPTPPDPSAARPPSPVRGGKGASSSAP